MTSSSEVIFLGVLFREEGEWLRVATDDITLAESIAFLQPGDSVRIAVKGSIVQVKSRYHQLVSVDVVSNFTTDSIEGEVLQALALYKLALIKTSYRSFWHRVSCKMKYKEALENERRLVVQESQCRRVVHLSAAHKEILEVLISRQTPFARENDPFSHLLEP